MIAAVVTLASLSLLLGGLVALLIYQGKASTAAWRARDEAVVDRNAFERRAVVAEKELQHASQRILGLRADLEACEESVTRKSMQIITGLSGAELAARTTELFAEDMSSDRPDTDRDGSDPTGALPDPTGTGTAADRSDL